MEETCDLKPGNNSSCEFNDELLLALERSGKTLVEIQSIILPWGNEKSEDMITVDGTQYSNDSKSYPKKRARIRELLDATFAAKEQSDAALQEMTRKLKLATEEKKSSDMRYKYLTSIAQKKFGIAKSNKRKFVAKSLTSGALGSMPDFQSKRQRFDDFGEDDEEESTAKQELPKQGEFSNSMDLEELRGVKFRRPKALLPGHGSKGVLIKYGSTSKSETSIAPAYFPVKREASMASSLSPRIRTVKRNRDFRPIKATGRSSGSEGAVRFSSPQITLRDEKDTLLENPEENSSPAYLSSPAPSITTAGTPYASDTDSDKSCGVVTDTKGFRFTTREPSEFEPAELQHSAAITADSNSTNTDCINADLAALREHKRSVEREFLNEAHSLSHTAALQQVAESDEEEEEEEEVRRNTIHRRFPTTWALGEEEEVYLEPNRSPRPALGNPEEKEDENLAAKQERFVAGWNGGLSDSGASDSNNENFLASDMGGADPSNNFAADHAEGGDPEAGNGLVEESVEAFSVDRSE